MAKFIKYKFLAGEVNHGIEEPNIEQIFLDATVGWNEVNEETAKREAYKGEYEIVDDGKPEPVAEPTADEILNALLGVSA